MNADLFHAGVRRQAVFHPHSRDHRVCLIREWGDADKAVFIMANPSTADASTDDPTIRRCMAFARSWGCGGLWVVNAYTYVSPSPKALKNWLDGLGRWDREYWETEALGYTIAATAGTRAPIIAAWGNLIPDLQWAATLASTLIRQGRKLHHLGLTKDGHPKHPLARGHHRIPDDQQPIPWAGYGVI
ncbi:MAG: DUF1643 domain-containing protein [Rhodospirillaceae bacterium]|nr:DUF1643 domain-containing protein [Rhodospirillales bacterium]